MHLTRYVLAPNARIAAECAIGEWAEEGREVSVYEVHDLGADYWQVEGFVGVAVRT